MANDLRSVCGFAIFAHLRRFSQRSGSWILENRLENCSMDVVEHSSEWRMKRKWRNYNLVTDKWSNHSSFNFCPRLLPSFRHSGPKRKRPFIHLHVDKSSKRERQAKPAHILFLIELANKYEFPSNASRSWETLHLLADRNLLYPLLFWKTQKRFWGNQLCCCSLSLFHDPPTTRSLVALSLFNVEGWAYLVEPLIIIKSLLDGETLK